MKLFLLAYNVVAEVPLSVTISNAGHLAFFLIANKRIRMFELEFLISSAF